MCTGFMKKGDDLLYGFNLDIDPAVWNFGLYKTKDIFTVGIKVGSTLYYTHGVNRHGRFSNLPYMNGDDFLPEKGKKRERIDLLTNRYLRGRYSFDDVLAIVQNKTLVNVPGGSMHSLIGDENGRTLLVEPGLGYREITGNYAVIANFPLLTELSDYGNPFYGKDRYDKAEEILKNSPASFSAMDGMKLLENVKQEGQWGTKVSFVYSKNENAVYYCLNGDFEHIEKHEWGQ